MLTVDLEMVAEFLLVLKILSLAQSFEKIFEKIFEENIKFVVARLQEAVSEVWDVMVILRTQI